jgi:predicted O-methyltransferase YrrM
VFWRLKRNGPDDPGDPLLWHVDFIVALARLLRPAVYVELGVHRAELFNRIIPYAGELIGVDIDPRSGDFVKTVPNARFVLGTTEAFANDLRDSPIVIDLLFIDADHCRESVVRDFRDFLPFVRPHGLILVHDTHPGDASLLKPEWCGDAYLAVDDLQRDAHDYEMMTIPVSPGLTLCRKRTSQLSWTEEGDVMSHGDTARGGST